MLTYEAAKIHNKAFPEHKKQILTSRYFLKVEQFLQIALENQKITFGDRNSQIIVENPFLKLPKYIFYKEKQYNNLYDQRQSQLLASLLPKELGKNFLKLQEQVQDEETTGRQEDERPVL